MKLKPRILYSIFQLLLLAFYPLTSKSQGHEGMIINANESSNYILKDFDAENRLDKYQVYIVGKNLQEGSKFNLPVSIYYYNQNGQLLDSTHTFYKCEREEQKMFMTFLFHAGKNSGSKVSITQTDTSSFFPYPVNRNASLPDVSLELDIEGGFGGFVNATGKMIFYDREAKPLEGPQYSVSGKLSFKSYVFGLKISTNQYIFSEKLNLSNDIIFQKFVEAKGNYFTIEPNQ